MDKRIVLIGAGSAQFGCGTMGDIFQSEVLEGCQIVLHDINPDALARVEAIGQQFIQEHQLPHTLSATTSRAEALAGADYCVISIEVGDRFRLWEQDWHIPQQYGIRQVYGENGGAGGLFHSLRIVPPILEICGDVMAICPEAYVFNFSNPMSRICTTVQRKFPNLRLIGLCHEIISLCYHLSKMLDLPYEELRMRAGGLNHFSVMLELVYRETGEDAYPDVRARAPQYFAQMPSLSDVVKYHKETGQWPDAEDEVDFEPRTEYWPERGLFRVILEEFGYLPITTDSHFGEYIPWAYDVVDHQGILDFYRFYKSWLPQAEAKIELKLSERVVPIIEGIETDAGYEEEAVNIPNNGAIASLPDWLVVEVPAKVDKDGVHGVRLGELPKGFAGLLQNQVAVHDLTAAAILEGSRAAVLQALLVDPVVDRYSGMKEMIDVFLSRQSRYLDYLK